MATRFLRKTFLGFKAGKKLFKRLTSAMGKKSTATSFLK